MSFPRKNRASVGPSSRWDDARNENQSWKRRFWNHPRKRLNKKIRFFSSSLKHRCSNLHFSPFQVCFFHFSSSLEHLSKLTLESVEVSRGVKFKPFYFSGDKKKVLAPHQSWGSTPKFGIKLKLDPEMPLSGFPVFRNTRNFFSHSLIPPR